MEILWFSFEIKIQEYQKFLTRNLPENRLIFQRQIFDDFQLKCFRWNLENISIEFQFSKFVMYACNFNYNYWNILMEMFVGIPMGLLCPVIIEFGPIRLK